MHWAAAVATWAWRVPNRAGMAMRCEPGAVEHPRHRCRARGLMRTLDVSLGLPGLLDRRAGGLESSALDVGPASLIFTSGREMEGA